MIIINAHLGSLRKNVQSFLFHLSFNIEFLTGDCRGLSTEGAMKAERTPRDFPSGGLTMSQ